MSKYTIKILTPLHISSGVEFERDYNLLFDDKFAYIFDEFKIVEFFVSKNIQIPTNFNELKSRLPIIKKSLYHQNYTKELSKHHL